MALNMKIRFMAFILFASLIHFTSLVEGGLRSQMFSRFSDESDEGTNWAVLVAGSNSFENYRHQADICHAYQILKKGGLSDDNIIVFMYDDIAFNNKNPTPGVIINSPQGDNVYPGVPKDYTGEDVNENNLFAVLLGNGTAVTGGSGKVLKSGPNDNVFFYYADHGGPGGLAMPADEFILANDFIYVLQIMYTSQSYKQMVIYVEACESGSIFDGLLPENMNIYVTTAANPTESSWACYCDTQGLPCLGDMYSVSWMEDSDKFDPNESLENQYSVVQSRTAAGSGQGSSHVMQYGDLSMSSELLSQYMGSNSGQGSDTNSIPPPPLSVVEQREADLFHLKQKVKRAPEGSDELADAQRKLDEEISRRKHVDQTVAKIGENLFGSTNAGILYKVRPAGQPLVDDWGCLKAMVKTYEQKCGLLKDYGRKYIRAFANICNAGIHSHQMALTATDVCVRGHN